jgi:hypothetical protein
LVGSTVQDVIVSVPHFAEALLRNIPYRYVLIEKTSAGVKFRKKEVPVWYTDIYRPISSTDYKSILLLLWTSSAVKF